MALSRTHLVGDAWWVSARWYDLGFRRINQGTDSTAMLDTVKLGKSIGILLEIKDDLQLVPKGDARKESRANKIWAGETRRTVICLQIFVEVIARLD